MVAGEETPDWADRAADFVQFNRDNAGDAQLGSFFMLLASVALLWFVSHLRAELGRFEQAARGFTRLSHMALAGGTVAAVGMALTALMTAVAVSQPDDTAGDVVRALHHASWASWSIVSVGLVVLLFAASLLILRTAVLPSWLGWVGLVGGVAQLLLLSIVLAPDDDEFVLGFAWVPGFLALMIWIVGSSIIFMLRAGRPEQLDARRPGGDEPPARTV